ncbi:MAG: CGNR zinc finger domain-containing protein [Gemmatimonadales bacterium]
MPQSQQAFGGVPCIDFANGAELPEAVDNPAAMRAAARFRVVLHRLLRAEALGEGAAERDLARLNRILSQGQNHRGVLPAVRGYGWGWIGPAEDVERVLWPVAWSAALLLAGADLVRLKCCDGCGRLFFDASRNRSRRWCDMQGCGNRAKVARHRLRSG